MATTLLRRFASACAVGGALSLGASRAHAGEVAGPAAVKPAATDPARARFEYEAAKQHFEAEEYLEAAKALERAYAHDPQLDYLYQRGHALRLAGNCEAALMVFGEVEHAVEGSAQREEVATWIERCRRVLDEGAVGSSPAADPVAPDPSPSDPPGRPPDRPSPVRRDLAAGLTLGLGSAAVVAGSALLISSATTARGGDATENELDYEARVRRSDALELSGAIVLSVGAVAVVAAVVRYAVLHRRRTRLVFGAPGRRLGGLIGRGAPIAWP
ncbi:MAG: hypothetical protein AAGF11_43535 [Myxococcota bacterium]